MREPDETKTSSVFSQRVVRVGCEINVETTTGVEFYVPFGNRVIREYDVIFSKIPHGLKL